MADERGERGRRREGVAEEWVRRSDERREVRTRECAARRVVRHRRVRRARVPVDESSGSVRLELRVGPFDLHRVCVRVVLVIVPSRVIRLGFDLRRARAGVR